MKELSPKPTKASDRTIVPMRDSAIPVGGWDRVRFVSSVVTIGAFRVMPCDPHFETAGRITAPVFVFPRTAVWIQHEGQQAFVADPSIVTYYNRGQPYRRKKLGPEGDFCDWFRVAPGILQEMVRWHDPRWVDMGRGPFPFSHGRSDARSYFLQRCVIRHLSETQEPDLLFVEETILSVLWRCLGTAFRDRARTSRPNMGAVHQRQLEIAHATKAILAEGFRDALTLAGLATKVDCSVFHLCRIFRRYVGSTIHGHRLQLRLRAALDRLPGAENDLTQLALDLGFSSHSHFTAAFRQAFGMPPSQVSRLSTSDVFRLLHSRKNPPVPSGARG